MRSLPFAAAVVFSIASFAAPVAAQESAFQAGQIYNAGGGARALGMGGATTALVRDVTALYYNPAGLALLPEREVSLMQAQLYEGAAYQYLGYAQNMKRKPGAWGLELLRLGASGGTGRDLNNAPTGDFGYNELSMAGGAGLRGLLHPDLSLGVKAKRLTRSLGGSSDSMLGLDAGAQFGPLANERLTLGFTLQNAFTKAQGDTSDKFPAVARFGAAYRLAGSFLLAADVSNSREFRFGTEYLWGAAALRAGFTPQGLSFGTGFVFRQAYAFDLALVNHPTLGLSQRLSLGYRFKAGPQGRKMESFANEHLQNAILELEKGEYVKASKDLDTALGINPRLGDQGWKVTARRLRDLIEALELSAHPAAQEAFRTQGPQGHLGRRAVSSYLEREDQKAMLFAHAAHGQDTREQWFRTLLQTLSKATRIEVRREDILPPATLAARRLRDAVDAIYVQRYEVGIRACKDALVLDPNNAMAWMRLGSAYFAAGDKVNAKAAYRNALALEPGDDRLRQFMAQQGMND